MAIRLTAATAQVIGDLIDRSIRPVITILFAGTICWIAIRSNIAITADQFVGIVMAAILFWFGARGAGGSTSHPTTTTTTPDTKTVTGPTPPTPG